MCLAAFAALRAAEGQAVDAAQFCWAVDALLESLRTGLLPLDHSLYERRLVDLHYKLDAAAFDATRAAGHALKFEEALALVPGEVPTQ